MLDGQPRAAVTDSIGRFRLDSVSAGLYRVGIFHPILDSLGTSLATRPVRFNAGKPILISLATPSGRTLRHAICPEMPPRASGYEHGDSGIAVLVGRVLDPDSDIVPVQSRDSDARVGANGLCRYGGASHATTSARRRRATSATFGSAHFRQGSPECCVSPEARIVKTAVERELALDDRIVTMATLHLVRGHRRARRSLARDRRAHRRYRATRRHSVRRRHGHSRRNTGFDRRRQHWRLHDARAAGWNAYGARTIRRVRASLQCRRAHEPESRSTSASHSRLLLANWIP